MKKILILSASPRKDGNSDMLCNEFLRGAKESGNEVEKIFLKDKKINYCYGCEVCNKTHKCVQNDDMEDILNKMVKADVIVLATSVYFYTMNAQLKTLIDRTVPRYNEISNKEFYYFVTAADNDSSMLERTVDGIRGFTEDCLDASIEKGIILACGLWHKNDIKNSKYLEQAYLMGKNA